MTDVATAGPVSAGPHDLERHRRELTGYCYRMLGSAFEAEDAVQETLVRAWRRIDRFEGRSALRSWLYRIATNVCFDMLGASQRRARPMDLGPRPAPRPRRWRPACRSHLGRADAGRHASCPPVGDPADVAVARDSVRLAFVAALQYLPPRQRAVLILREVLRWHADEVAELLETSVASVNSALQRARATLAGQPTPAPAPRWTTASRQLLDRYVDAFERYDIDALIALLHEDATMSMPPFDHWLRGKDDILRFWLGQGAGCRGSWLVPTAANGSPAYAQYKPSGPGGAHQPWALQVLRTSGDRIVELTFFLSTDALFPLFGLPQQPEARTT